MSTRAARAVLAVVAVVVAAGCSGSDHPSSGSGSTPTVASPGPPPATSDAPRLPRQWLGYHADRHRTGAIGSGPAPRHATVAWNADLGAAVRGQPVVADGRIIAATEKNRVVALRPSDGTVLWSRSLGPPLTNVVSAAGCGNIDPLGITSTPVVDPRTGTVYVVGEIDDGGGKVHHQLEALSVRTGAIRRSLNVDPPLPSGEHAVNLLQRASLALGNGRVYVPYGGNIGDCGDYHGWVVGVKTTGSADKVSFEVAPDGHGGAIWESGGAPALDAQGHVYVTTGNANPAPPQGGPDPKKYTESVVKLSPDLTPLASYKDRVAGGDEDLATGNPVLLPGGRLFAVGKTDIAYILRRKDLSEVNEIQGVCGSDPDGGPAYDRADDRMFVPCRDGGIQIVDLGDGKLGSKLDGADSAPILIGRHLWALDHASGTLSEYEASTGKQVQSVDLGADIPIFTSPSAGLGLLLVATEQGVLALH